MACKGPPPFFIQKKCPPGGGELNMKATVIKNFTIHKESQPLLNSRHNYQLKLYECHNHFCGVSLPL